MSLKSDYEKVCEFNKAFDFPQYDDFSNEKTLKLRLDLIKEELTELKDAYSNNDTVEILDACADILYVAYGMAYTYKIDSDEFLNYLYLDKSKTLFRNIVNAIVGSDIKYDQVILEYDRWCHIGFAEDGKEPRLEQLIIDKEGTRRYGN